MWIKKWVTFWNERFQGLPCFDETSLLLPTSPQSVAPVCWLFVTPDRCLEKEQHLGGFILGLKCYWWSRRLKTWTTSWNLIHFCFLEEYTKLLPIYTRFTIGIYRESTHQDFMECFPKGFDLNFLGLFGTLPGAEAFGEAVSSNHALQRLDLSNNGIKGAGAQTQTRRSMETSSSSWSKLYNVVFWLKKTSVSTTWSLNTLHDYMKNTWHFWFGVLWLIPHFSDSVGTWFFAPGAIAFFNGLKNNQTLAQLVMELNPIGATGGWCDGFKGRWTLFFFRVLFTLTHFFEPPPKKINSPLGELCSICSLGVQVVWKSCESFCWQIWSPSKKNQPFFKNRSRQLPQLLPLFPIPFSMRCHSPGGGLAAASSAPILGALAAWGVGGLGHVGARLQGVTAWKRGWLHQSHASPESLNQNLGRKKRLGRTYDWQIWGLMDAFKWQKA